MKIFDLHFPTSQGRAAKDQQAFLMGLSFHEAALRAGKQVSDPDGAPVTACCPMVVCYAFAAELYLKSLVQTPITNHRLNVLNDRLSSEIQAAVGARYEARTGRNSVSLRQDLRTFANAFREWRYIFEGEGQQIRLNLLIAFTQAVYEIVRLYRSEWQVSSDRDARLRASELEHVTLANLGGGTFIHVMDGTGTINQPEA
jgi:hypothetical protein